jgi:hypothetical protein
MDAFAFPAYRLLQEIVPSNRPDLQVHIVVMQVMTDDEPRSSFAKIAIKSYLARQQIAG